ncbi:MAG: hypothetical protein M3274_02845 [Actinomycetota bacterium]|nr:hypothetical protein [Actinomycetota bacterium]
MDIAFHRRLWVFALGIAAAMMVAAGLALAAVEDASAKPITITTHNRELQEGRDTVYIDTFVCTGDELYRLSTPANELFHVTASGIDENGDYIPPFIIHFSGFGRVVAVPVDGTGPTYTGHFKEGPEQLIVKQFPPFIGTYLDKETVIVKGSDGSRLHLRHQVVFHVNANGKVTVDRESFWPTTGCNLSE